MSTPGQAMLVLVAVATMACAGTPRGEPGRSNADVITAQELANHRDVSALQAIERLRPIFLRSRGPSSILLPETDDIAVYVGNARVGGVEFLREIRAGDISEIRHLSAAQATTRYGMGNSAGAIVITLR